MVASLGLAWPGLSLGGCQPARLRVLCLCVVCGYFCALFDRGLFVRLVLARVPHFDTATMYAPTWLGRGRTVS